MHTLTPGANASLSQNRITIRVQCARNIDVAAYRLTASGKVRGDGDMIFYGQTQSDDSSVRYAGSEQDCRFEIDLAGQAAAVERIAIAFSADQAVAQLGQLVLTVLENGAETLQCPVSLEGRQEKALILGECYRRNNQWKFRFIAQGFNGGLKPLSEHFGVEISDDATPPATPAAAVTPPPAASTISLSKITLDKRQSSINLRKKDDFGHIRVNLNWNRGAQPQGKPGFLDSLLGKKRGIDLDLGVFVRLKNGFKDCIQALGGRFGALDKAPFVCLRGDDRTGQAADGEWLDINGSQWQHIDEILVYAFIYEGVPNWNATDGVVTLYVQGQQIETHLTDGDSRHSMCAVARLVNDNGSIQVERINRYFQGQKDMDRAFGWGFDWVAGRK